MSEPNCLTLNASNQSTPTSPVIRSGCNTGFDHTDWLSLTSSYNGGGRCFTRLRQVEWKMGKYMDADDDDAGTRGAAPLKCGYKIRRIYKKAQIIENLSETMLYKFEKWLLTQQHTKLSYFLRESRDFLPLPPLFAVFFSVKTLNRKCMFSYCQLNKVHFLISNSNFYF